MSDTRNPEDTVCPIFTLVNAILGLAEDRVETPCKGKVCHMYETSTKKCGLRSR